MKIFKAAAQLVFEVIAGLGVMVIALTCGTTIAYCLLYLLGGECDDDGIEEMIFGAVFIFAAHNFVLLVLLGIIKIP